MTEVVAIREQLSTPGGSSRTRSTPSCHPCPPVLLTVSSSPLSGSVREDFCIPSTPPALSTCYHPTSQLVYMFCVFYKVREDGTFIRVSKQPGHSVSNVEGVHSFLQEDECIYVSLLSWLLSKQLPASLSCV